MSSNAPCGCYPQGNDGDCPAPGGYAGMARDHDKHGALIELAATWCEAQGRAKLDPMAPIWERRAKMLREGYKPQLVSAPSATDSTLAALLAKSGPRPWYIDADNRPGMDWNRHIFSADGLAVCFMAHSDGKAPMRDSANAELIVAAVNSIASSAVTETVARKESIPEAWKINPIGYAVRMKNGPFVGIWQDRATADMVRDKQPASHGDEVIPVWSSPRAEADADQAKDAARWIPVSERLPEDGIDVLVRGTNGFISIDSLESFEGFDVAVTHWMPLPDGPHGE